MTGPRRARDLRRAAGAVVAAFPASIAFVRRRPRARAVLGALTVSAVVIGARSHQAPDPSEGRSAALAGSLAARGLTCTAEDVSWLDAAPAEGTSLSLPVHGRALVRASENAEPTDLYAVDADLTPEGKLLALGGVWNVTRTSGVDESRPVLAGPLAAYVTSIDGTYTGLHTLNLAGRSPADYTEFTRVQQWQTALTNLQQTGSTRGVVHDAYAFDPTVTEVTFAFEGDALEVRADGRTIRLDPAADRILEGAGWLRAAPEQKAKPGNLVTWSVDRVRAMPWFGEEKMQWLKAVAFTGLDWVLRVRADVFGDHSAHEVAEDMGGLNGGDARKLGASATYVDPELGWPPARMTPVLSPALAGEGEWIALDRDPFVATSPGVPAAFVTSFVRADRARPQTRVYVTLWDPRQVALHMEAGTVEPVSATGEAGPGVVPRTPEVVRRLVGGFNGGFQALHGEYGMQANGVLYLPPKPYAATVLEMKDGATAFGSWPGSSEVPADILSYRQNMTALVEHGKWNPWGRTWWGGTPKGWADNIHTTRSGICLTREGFVGYFYGLDISAEVLAQGMLLARCTYGIHLDMNPGLAGFEFYDVQPSGSFQPLGRKLQDEWEYEGGFRDLPDFKVRARRMIRGMQHVNFPQYIHRDGRDFFYLTLRPLLPGLRMPILAGAFAPPATAAATTSEPGEGVWKTKGLPQHGFPYSLASTYLRPDPSSPELRVRVLRVDPRTVNVAGSAGTNADTPTVVTFTASSAGAHEADAGDAPGGHRASAGHRAHAAGVGLHLWHSREVFSITSAPPPGDEDDAHATPSVLAAGIASDTAGSASSQARAAAGVQDEDGMLEWLELAPEVPATAKTARLLDALLAQSGCSSRMLVLGDAHALPGGTQDLTGTAAPAAFDAARAVTRLVRATAPAAHPTFESTPIVSPNVWQPLQSQRVRYFHHPKKAPVESTSTDATGGDETGGADTSAPAEGTSGAPAP